MIGTGNVATLPQLCEALAPHDGRPVSTLLAVGVRLREAGLIRSGARGRGALQIDPVECASLVLASLWTESATASPDAIRLLAGLKWRRIAELQSLPYKLEIVANLPTFGEALAVLIEFGDGVRRELANELGGQNLEVTVAGPVPFATLELVDGNGRFTVLADWSLDNDQLVQYRQTVAELRMVDRRHSTTISGRTLFRLADLVRSRREIV